MNPSEIEENMNSAVLSIKVKTLDSSVYDISIEKSKLVTDLKAMLVEKTSIPVELQRLIYKGKLLKNGDNLSQCKIEEGTVLHLVSNPHGASTSSQGSDGRANAGNQGGINFHGPRTEENSNRPSGEGSSNEGANLGSEELQLIQLLQTYNLIENGFRGRLRRARRNANIPTGQETFEAFRQNMLTIRTILRARRERNTVNLSTTLTLEPFDRNRNRFVPGQWVDVRDTVDQWLEAQVIGIRDNQVHIHYNCWAQRWDEWLPADSPRIEIFRTHTHQRGAPCMSPFPGHTPDADISSLPVPEHNSYELIQDSFVIFRDVMMLLEEFASFYLASPLPSARLNVNTEREEGKEEEVPESIASSEMFQTAMSTLSGSEIPDTSHYDRTHRALHAAQLAPIVDRVGRLISDLAPHLLSFANVMWQHAGQESDDEEEDIFHSAVENENESSSSENRQLGGSTLSENPGNRPRMGEPSSRTAGSAAQTNERQIDSYIKPITNERADSRDRRGETNSLDIHIHTLVNDSQPTTNNQNTTTTTSTTTTPNPLQPMMVNYPTNTTTTSQPNQTSHNQLTNQILTSLLARSHQNQPTTTPTTTEPTQTTITPGNHNAISQTRIISNRQSSSSEPIDGAERRSYDPDRDAEEFNELFEGTDVGGENVENTGESGVNVEDLGVRESGEGEQGGNGGGGGDRAANAHAELNEIASLINSIAELTQLERQIESARSHFLQRYGNDERRGEERTVHEREAERARDRGTGDIFSEADVVDVPLSSQRSSAGGSQAREREEVTERSQPVSSEASSVRGQRIVIREEVSEEREEETETSQLNERTRPTSTLSDARNEHISRIEPTRMMVRPSVETRDIGVSTDDFAGDMNISSSMIVGSGNPSTSVLNLGRAILERGPHRSLVVTHWSRDLRLPLAQRLLSLQDNSEETKPSSSSLA